MGVEISEMYWMKDNLNTFQTYIDVLTLNFRKTVIIRFERGNVSNLASAIAF